MPAITIKVIDGQVTVLYEKKTSENIDKRLRQLKAALDVEWYGVATVFNLKPTEANVRLMRRWCRDPSKASYQEMPESQWKLLLTLTEGQPPIDTLSKESNNQ